MVSKKCLLPLVITIEMESNNLCVFIIARLQVAANRSTLSLREKKNFVTPITPSSWSPCHTGWQTAINLGGRGPLLGKNRRLVYRWTGWVWEITGWSQTTDNFRGIYRIYLEGMKAAKSEDVNQHVTNRLVLGSLGSWPTLYMPKNLLPGSDGEDFWAKPVEIL